MPKPTPVKRAIALGETALTLTEQVVPEALSQHFSVSVNGLVVTGKPAFVHYDQMARKLRVIERGVQFAIGDIANRIEEELGEEGSQILDYTEGWSEKTLGLYRWMAKSIAPERRRMDRLGVKHHLAVAHLPARQQDKWLTLAANEDGEPWTYQRLVAAMKANGDVEVSSLWVIVSAKDEEDQKALQAAMEKQGRTVKLQESRRKRKES